MGLSACRFVGRTLMACLTQPARHTTRPTISRPATAGSTSRAGAYRTIRANPGIIVLVELLAILVY